MQIHRMGNFCAYAHDTKAVSKSCFNWTAEEVKIRKPNVEQKKTIGFIERMLGISFSGETYRDALNHIKLYIDMAMERAVSI